MYKYMSNYSYIKRCIMKKTYKLEDLGCANCALKMEDAISKLEGVNSASINFVTQKLKLDTISDDQSDILEAAQKEVKKIERYCKIVY